MTAKIYYTVQGSVRGNISIRHRSLDAAVRVHDRDHSACRSFGGGAFSDVAIYRHEGDTIELMVDVGYEGSPRWTTWKEYASSSRPVVNK